MQHDRLAETLPTGEMHRQQSRFLNLEQEMDLYDEIVEQQRAHGIAFSLDSLELGARRGRVVGQGGGGRWGYMAGM